MARRVCGGASRVGSERLGRRERHESVRMREVVDRVEERVQPWALDDVARERAGARGSRARGELGVDRPRRRGRVGGHVGRPVAPAGVT